MFCLRDFTHKAIDLFSFRPMVSAQKVMYHNGQISFPYGYVDSSQMNARFWADASSLSFYTVPKSSKMFEDSHLHQNQLGYWRSSKYIDRALSLIANPLFKRVANTLKQWVCKEGGNNDITTMALHCCLTSKRS